MKNIFYWPGSGSELTKFCGSVSDQCGSTSLITQVARIRWFLAYRIWFIYIYAYLYKYCRHHYQRIIFYKRHVPSSGTASLWNVYASILWTLCSRILTLLFGVIEAGVQDRGVHGLCQPRILLIARTRRHFFYFCKCNRKSKLGCTHWFISVTVIGSIIQKLC